MTEPGPVSPFAAGLACKCPRCGRGTLFDGYLTLRRACDACGLDYSKADSGDGPAVFVMFIVGFIAVGIAFFTRFALDAPIWLALALSVGVATGLILVLLRPFKATLIALQYAHKAEEGRLDQ